MELLCTPLAPRRAVHPSMGHLSSKFQPTLSSPPTPVPSTHWFPRGQTGILRSSNAVQLNLPQTRPAAASMPASRYPSQRPTTSAGSGTGSAPNPARLPSPRARDGVAVLALVGWPTRRVSSPVHRETLMTDAGTGPATKNLTALSLPLVALFSLRFLELSPFHGPAPLSALSHGPLPLEPTVDRGGASLTGDGERCDHDGCQLGIGREDLMRESISLLQPCRRTALTGAWAKLEEYHPPGPLSGPLAARPLRAATRPPQAWLQSKRRHARR